jgi:pyrroloquinoline quinone biosynthesis protein B
VLFNASPDVRTQITAFPPLSPPPGSLRGSGLSAIVLTNADIDHCAGLLVLREGGAPPIYCTDRVRTALTEGLSILPVLQAYGTVDCRAVIPGQTFEVKDREGESLGLKIEPFAVASKPPPYMTQLFPQAVRDDLAGGTIGLIIEGNDAGRLAYVPGVRELNEDLRARLVRTDLVLIDGTFFTDDEMVRLGASKKTAREMGHAPLDGPDGLLAFLSTLERPRKVLIHLNNTNPMLRENSSEAQKVSEAGVQIAFDGLEMVV